jgi:hypothetical protein
MIAEVAMSVTGQHLRPITGTSERQARGGGVEAEEGDTVSEVAANEDELGLVAAK